MGRCFRECFSQRLDASFREYGGSLYFWNNIEDVLGHTNFILLYGIHGVIAVMSHAAIDPEFTNPMVGASGAISGVLVAYLLLDPCVSSSFFSIWFSI